VSATRSRSQQSPPSRLLPALLWAFLRPESILSLERAPDVLLLVLVVGIYILAADPVGVLITFPAARYIDSAAVLLPALPLYAAFHLVEALRRA
jgi:hypothetical protein